MIASFCYTIAFFLQLLAIPRIGQSKTALLLYAEPIVAILSAIYLLDESLNNYQIFGAVLVLSSLAFATYITQKN
jgi:drug/metabolite transporter (DMT)-like permease